MSKSFEITCDSLFKYCQKRNGPGRWFHITSSNTNFDQVSSSKSRSSINSKISSREASPQNLNFKIWTKPSFRISTEIQLHNLNQTSAEKYWPKFIFKLLPKLQLQNLNKTKYPSKYLSLRQTSFSKSAPSCCQQVSQHQKYWVRISSRQGHITQVY